MAWARVAWSRYTGKGSGRRLVVYAMEWPNPRPEKAIESVDVLSGNTDDTDYGAPVLFAISTAQEPRRGRTFYVAPAPGGSDDNPGTLDKPWASVHKAAAEMAPGDTVYVRGGLYTVEERIEVQKSGVKGKWITYCGYPGETPVIDARNVALGANTRTGAFNMPEVSYIRVKGLQVHNSQCQGITAKGHAHHIDILHNTVFYTSNTGIGSWRAEVGSCHHVRVIGNLLLATCSSAANKQFHNLDKRPGDECLDAGGTVDYEYAYNEIAYGDKEGIDCKGPCRRGVVHHNWVHHTGSIYIDVWNDVLEDIEVCYNVNHDSWGGFKLSTEGAAPARNVRFHHNLAYDNRAHGIYVTNYGEQKGNNDKTGIAIWNNTCHNNGQFGIFLEGQEVRDVAIRNNICTANGRFQIGAAGQDFEALNIAIDHNLIDAFTDTTKEKRAVKGDALIIGDPMFVDPTAGDFRLRGESPAIDAGHEAPRYNDPDGTRADMGAFYYPQ
jgi:hypothetical protein